MKRLYRLERCKHWVTLLTLVTLTVAPALSSLTAMANPAASSSTSAASAVSTSIPQATGNNQQLSMKHFGDPNGYRLKTVRTQRDYHFTRPKGWNVQPSSHLRLSFQHGANLLPERSSLNVLVNNRILKSIPLGKDNVLPTTVSVPVPPSLLKDNNILSFQVDQHYTYDCEDPFSEELWTELLPDTALNLHYTWKNVRPDLAQYPFPLLDPLNNYTPSVMGYVVPETASDQTLEAFGVVATHLGQQAKWRSIKPHLADEEALYSDDHLVLIGTPQENRAIASIAGSLSVSLSGDQFVNEQGAALPADYGVLQMVPNPNNPARVVLVVSGNGPDGVKKAAHVLAQNAINKTLAGRSAIIKDYNPGAPYPYRAWEGFILKSGDTFANLGLKTQTTRGITGLPLFYHIKMMPDIFLPGRRHARLHTVYSYASQMDVSQSKLEVLLNGKAIKSVPLDDKNGKSLAELTVDIPTEEIYTFNDLEYRFHMYPEKYDKCRFVTDVHIWGTVHNNSHLEFPGELKTPLPDVGLINDGGYPFSAYQDFSQTTMVLPDAVRPTDLEALLHLATRLGRESSSRKGIELAVHKAGSLPDHNKKNHHLVIIGQRSQQSQLLNEMKDKASLLMDGEWKSLQDDQKNRLAEINYTPGQGIVEQLLSPWNDKRVVMLLTGEDDTALIRNAQLFQNDEWFGKINQGNLTVVNDLGPQSTILLTKGEARFFYPQDLKDGFQLPSWVWIIVGFFAVLGLLSLIRFLFGR